MKNFMRTIAAVCVTASLAVTAAGCSGDKSNSNQNMPRETISLEQTKQELTFNYKQGGATLDATEAEEDATEAAEDETIMEEVTELVTETNADGQAVTDAKGAVQTQAVVVETRPKTATASGSNKNAATEAAANADDSSSGKPVNQVAGANEEQLGGSGNNSSGDNSSGGGNNNADPVETQAVETPYTPVYDTCKAYWLDMTQQGDYFFNGEFLSITFQVKEGIPDGSYPVTIAATDIASWDLIQYTPVCIDGEVAVNTDVKKQDAVDATSDFTLKLNSTTAKQGDTVTVTVDLANNPGFCGFVVDIQYDSNALTIVEATGGADFQKAVHVNDNVGSTES